MYENVDIFFWNRIKGLIDTHNCVLKDTLPCNNMIYYDNDDLWISFSMTSFGNFFFVPLIWHHFYPLRLKKPVKYLGSNLIFCWHASNLGWCSQISSAIFLARSELKFFEKILSQLGIEQFLKLQVIRDHKKTGKDNYNGANRCFWTFSIIRLFFSGF